MAALQAMRIHQWAKNLLLFVPLFLAHRFTDAGLLLKVGIAICAFSLIASAFYIVNDLVDAKDDRAHPFKKDRAVASGRLSIVPAVASTILCLGGGVVLALAFLNSQFLIVLLLYAVLTTLYTFFLKQIIVVDVLLLASFYALRIFAGGVVIDIPISHWLVSFSVFFFLSLAFLKRFTDLRLLDSEHVPDVKGRGYSTSDHSVLRTLGVASGVVSVLVLALYVTGDDVAILYEKPDLLWFITPPILYWISRAWILAQRGQMHHDPVAFAVSDPPSYLVAVLMVGIVILAGL